MTTVRDRYASARPSTRRGIGVIGTALAMSVAALTGSAVATSLKDAPVVGTADAPVEPVRVTVPEGEAPVVETDEGAAAVREVSSETAPRTAPVVPSPSASSASPTALPSPTAAAPSPFPVEESKAPEPVPSVQTEEPAPTEEPTASAEPEPTAEPTVQPSPGRGKKKG